MVNNFQNYDKSKLKDKFFDPPEEMEFLSPV
jgi:hypothetical protein